jgi:hypothetical protein
LILAKTTEKAANLKVQNEHSEEKELTGKGLPRLVSEHTLVAVPPICSLVRPFSLRIISKVLPMLSIARPVVGYKMDTTKLRLASGASCQKMAIPTGTPSLDLYMVAVAVRLTENPSSLETAA